MQVTSVLAEQTSAVLYLLSRAQEITPSADHTGLMCESSRPSSRATGVLQV